MQQNTVYLEEAVSIRKYWSNKPQRFLPAPTNALRLGLFLATVLAFSSSGLQVIHFLSSLDMPNATFLDCLAVMTQQASL